MKCASFNMEKTFNETGINNYEKIRSRLVEQRELVIIGAGPAGLTAAIYAKRAGLNVLVLEKNRAGGQILLTSEIENWPGTLHVSGQELAENFRKHAEFLKVEFRTASVNRIELHGEKKTIITADCEIETKALILATGASFRKLGCAGEHEFIGKGVSYCAVCDANMFEELDVAVVGGGNTAVEEACYLSQFAEKVYIIHRRDTFRADKIVAEHALSNPKIIPVWDSVVEEIYGDGLVEGIRIKNVKTDEISNIAVNGVFMFVGTSPNTQYLNNLVETVPGGWIKTDMDMGTSVPGVFAAGDLRETGLRQVITASGDGARAAMSAYAYLQRVTFS